MNTDETVRRNTAIKKSAHFTFYEERNRAIALLLVGQKGVKVNGDDR